MALLPWELSFPFHLTELVPGILELPHTHFCYAFFYNKSNFVADILQNLEIARFLYAYILSNLLLSWKCVFNILPILLSRRFLNKMNQQSKHWLHMKNLIPSHIFTKCTLWIYYLKIRRLQLWILELPQVHSMRIISINPHFYAGSSFRRKKLKKKINRKGNCCNMHFSILWKRWLFLNFASEIKRV